ncbi:MAG: hypothetical protein WD426_06310, partial [Anditalea sp.]
FETLGGFSKAISLPFSYLFNAYTQAYNKAYQRKGSLFIPNFNRNLMVSDSYFSALIIYIHQNPTHHGFAVDFTQWTFSSYQSYLSDKPSLLNKKEVLEWFGSLNGFIRDHGTSLSKEIKKHLEI